MMTEAEVDAAHDAYLDTAKALTALLEKKLKPLSLDQQQYVRDVLGDTFRFWKDDTFRA